MEWSQKLWELVAREFESSPIQTTASIASIIAAVAFMASLIFKRGRDFWKRVLSLKMKCFFHRIQSSAKRFWHYLKDRALASHSKESSLEQRLEKLEQLFDKIENEDTRERELLICRFLDASYKLKLPAVRGEEEIDFAILQIGNKRIKDRLTVFDSSQSSSFDPTSQWVGYLEANNVISDKDKEEINSVIRKIPPEPTKLTIYLWDNNQRVEIDIYVQFLHENRKEIALCKDEAQLKKGFKPYYLKVVKSAIQF